MSFAIEDPVHRSRKSRGDRLHSAAERLLSSRFDDQMEMVALDRVVADPEMTPLADLSQAGSKLAQEGLAPQRWNTGAYSERHVARIATD